MARSKQESVALCRHKVNSKAGKSYEYWVLRWYNPRTGKREHENLGRVDEIGVRDAERHKKVKAGQLLDKPNSAALGKSPTIKEITDAAKAERSRKSKATRWRYALASTMLIKYFGQQTRIDRITRSGSRAFISAVREGELDECKDYRNKVKGRESTALHVLMAARAIFQAAVDDDELDSNPFTKIRITVPGSKWWRKVDNDDFWALYDAASVGWKKIIALCRLAALSATDSQRLKWSAIDWDHRLLTYKRQKTDRIITVPICPELWTLLNEWRKESLAMNDRVATPPVHTGNVGRDWKVLLGRAGVEPYGDPLHALRKSCIDDWARSKPPHVVQAWAGHGDIKTTLKYYSQVTSEDFAKATKETFLAKNPAKKRLRLGTQ